MPQIFKRKIPFKLNPFFIQTKANLQEPNNQSRRCNDQYASEYHVVQKRMATSLMGIIIVTLVIVPIVSTARIW